MTPEQQLKEFKAAVAEAILILESGRVLKARELLEAVYSKVNK